MKLVVGLGNPGLQYEATKHNVGFRVLDAFAEEQQLVFSAKKGEALTSRGVLSGADGEIPFMLVKPQTFMNRSGRSVRTFLSYYKIPLSELILIYDDLDLDVGRIRVKRQGGAGGHRGVASVIQEVGSNQFVRLKIGIGKDPRIDSADYVLSPFRREDEPKISDAVGQGAALLPLLLEDKVHEAMNTFNAA